jgi:hypothetical protein
VAFEEIANWPLSVPTEVGAAVTASESCCPGCNVTGRATELGVKAELLDAIELMVVAVLPLAVRTRERELLSPVVMLPKDRDVGLDANVLVVAVPVPLRGMESELGLPLLDTVKLPE